MAQVASCTSAYAQYIVKLSKQGRLQIQESLCPQAILTAVHHPMPLALADLSNYLNRVRGIFPVAELVTQCVLSLPPVSLSVCGRGHEAVLGAEAGHQKQTISTNATA